ncbi:hypothetical protein EVAR_51915_1 [Eumeta japonica]|uniref:Uncharacterized protein n=1 Tax=Eumeta variegata TaxID=151549 RepID=A0A4C1XK38_EUMVA|nr:hypothetical protein EVAR_51915_1 [Eumeta japonica]
MLPARCYFSNGRRHARTPKRLVPIPNESHERAYAQNCLLSAKSTAAADEMTGQRRGGEGLLRECGRSARSGLAPYQINPLRNDLTPVMSSLFCRCSICDDEMLWVQINSFVLKEPSDATLKRSSGTRCEIAVEPNNMFPFAISHRNLRAPDRRRLVRHREGGRAHPRSERDACIRCERVRARKWPWLLPLATYGITLHAPY